jgi:hypothetical protein
VLLLNIQHYIRVVLSCFIAVLLEHIAVFSLLFTIEHNKTERIVRRVFILDPIIITISVSVAHLHFRFQPVVKQRRFLTVWIHGDYQVLSKVLYLYFVVVK